MRKEVYVFYTQKIIQRKDKPDTLHDLPPLSLYVTYLFPAESAFWRCPALTGSSSGKATRMAYCVMELVCGDVPDSQLGLVPAFLHL
jgi:hypothetical protein